MVQPMPFPKFRPPKLGKQKGSRTVSANLVGSQKPIGTPRRINGGFGIGHEQTGKLGALGISGASVPTETWTPPIVIGNKQDQHKSVIGLMITPLHTALAFNGAKNSIIAINNFFMAETIKKTIDPVTENPKWVC